MDVWLEYTGTIKCTSTTTGRQDQAVTLAAFDIDAMVIFPSVTETATTSGVEIVLPDIPLGREFSVVYRPASGGSYNNTPVATGVKLGVEGQSVEVPFDIP